MAPILDPQHQVHHVLKRVLGAKPGALWAFEGVSEQKLSEEEVLLA